MDCSKLVAWVVKSFLSANFRSALDTSLYSPIYKYLSYSCNVHATALILSSPKPNGYFASSSLSPASTDHDHASLSVTSPLQTPFTIAKVCKVPDSLFGFWRTRADHYVKGTTIFDYLINTAAAIYIVPVVCRIIEQVIHVCDHMERILSLRRIFGCSQKHAICIKTSCIVPFAP